MVWSAENLVPIGVVIWLGSADSRSHQRQGLGSVVAAVYAGDGGGPDRSRLDIKRGVAVQSAAMATDAEGLKPGAG